MPERRNKGGMDKGSRVRKVSRSAATHAFWQHPRIALPSKSISRKRRKNGKQTGTVKIDDKWGEKKGSSPGKENRLFV